jgi:8-oxo-dGTP diphosphatase
MQDDLKARVTAGTAIFRGNRILLLHRSVEASNPGIWDLPGGHVQSRETLARAARRETQEETGFQVRLGPLFHAETFSSLSKRSKMRRSVGVYFHCTAPPRKSPQLDPEEHTEYAWVSLTDLNDYPTLPFLSRTIRAAFLTKGLVGGPKNGGRVITITDSSSLAYPVPA